MNFNPFKWWSPKTQVSLFSLTIFLVGIWSLTFYVSNMLREDMQRVLGEQVFSTVSIVAAEVNQELGNRLRYLEKAAKKITPAILGNTKAIQAFLEERTSIDDMFSGGIYVTRLDGTVIADIPISTGRIGINYSDRDYIIETVKGKATMMVK